MALIPQIAEELYPQKFEEFDTNKSGVLEKDEAKLLFQSLCSEGAPQGYVFTDENFTAKF